MPEVAARIALPGIATEPMTTKNEPTDHQHARCARRHRHLFAGRARRRHRLPFRPDSAGSRPPCSWSAATSMPRSAACSTTSKAIAEAAGGTLDDAVKVTVFLTDLAHFARVNEIMATYFQQPYPARAAVGVAALPRGARVESGVRSEPVSRDAGVRSAVGRSAVPAAGPLRGPHAHHAASARCCRARARWSKAKCSWPTWCSAAAARCWCGSPTARAS